MKSFLLTTIPRGGVRVVSLEPDARKKDWDEFAVVIESRLNEAQLRTRYPMGFKMNRGLGFYLQDMEWRHAGAGLSRATLNFRGLFERKVWDEAGAALAVRQMDDLKIGTSTTVPKASVLDVTPTLMVHVYDAQSPPYALLGAKVAGTSPVPGVVFPVAAGVGPWQFWGSYVPTTNVLGGTTTTATAVALGGWALTDVQSDEVSGDTSVLGSINRLHGKRLSYTLFWPQVP